MFKLQKLEETTSFCGPQSVPGAKMKRLICSYFDHSYVIRTMIELNQSLLESRQRDLQLSCWELLQICKHTNLSETTFLQYGCKT